MKPRLVLPPLAIVAASAAAATLAFAAPDSSLRPYVVLGFALICPGMALVRLLRIGDPVLELAAAIGLSIAVETLTSTAMLYADLWSPKALLAALVSVAVAGAVVELAGYGARAPVGTP